MDIVTGLSKITLKLLRADKIIKSYDQNDYSYVENKIKNIRNKEVRINQEDVKQLVENGMLMFWSEILKFVVILLIAYFMNTFLATFLIMTIFTILRASAGGVHMSTINKCFAIMIGLFLSLGYIVNNILLTPLFLAMFFNLGFIWSILMAVKYAPQERPDKSDKDCDNGNKMKYRSIRLIIISCIVSLIFIHNQLVSLSVFVGVLLEIFTITPLGTKLFQWIDNKKVVE